MRKGFSLFEVLIYLSIAFVVTAVIVSFVFWLIDSNNKNRIMRETLSSAKRSVDIITFETRRAESIYTPTTAGSQLSLETNKYLAAGENSGYIDFYLCGTQLCLKKESQDPVIITPDNMVVSSLDFTYVVSQNKPSVKIDITVQYDNETGRPGYDFSTSLSSTVSLRSY